mgnify:CR=1 FL=1
MAGHSWRLLDAGIHPLQLATSPAHCVQYIRPCIQMYMFDFAGARWLQKENVTANNETASVAFYPPGPAAELAWSSAVQADENSDGSTLSSSTPRADLYGEGREFVLLIGRMPAMSELALDLSVSRDTELYITSLGKHMYVR